MSERTAKGDIEREFIETMRQLFELVRFYETDEKSESQRQLRFKYKVESNPENKQKVRKLFEKIRKLFGYDKETLNEVFRAACFFQDLPDADDIFRFHLKDLKKETPKVIPFPGKDVPEEDTERFDA